MWFWIFTIGGIIVALFGAMIGLVFFMDSRRGKLFILWWMNRKLKKLVEQQAYHRTMVTISDNQFSILCDERNRFADRNYLPAHPNRNNGENFDKWFSNLKEIAVEKLGFTDDSFEQTTDIEMWKHYFHKGYEPVDALREDFSSADL